MIKRLFDIIVCASALAVTAPLLACVALLVRWNLGSPVLFRQRRPGLYGKPFTILKFRTMRDEHGRDGRTLPDKERLTPFGAALRATSLDELPGLWNVLRGDMSIVGPRPLLMEYLPLYNEHQARRMDVRPGITGLAQVNGRNAIDWQRKFSLDVEYVERQTFWLDLWIIGRTVIKVLRRDGITAAGEATMQPFLGNVADGEV